MNTWWVVPLLWLSTALAPIAPHDAKTFNITARRFSYTVSPEPFTANQGDVVTLVITAADNGAGSGHGFRLQTYADQSLTLVPGDPPKTIQFTAHTAGEFTFFCTHFCGSGHSGMDGTFTVLGPQPLSVSDLEPTSGPTSGGTNVKIEGAGFVSGATVKFGTLDAASVQVVSANEIRAVTPPGPFDFANTRAVNVVITNPDGATAQKSFTWTVPAPLIASVSPALGTRAGGTLVTIRGGGFSTAVPVSVSFGGASATAVTVVDAVTLTAHTPAHATGAVDVAITTSKGSATSSSAFRFTAPRRRVVRP